MDHIVASCGPILPWINTIFISTTIVEAFFLQNLTYNWQKCQTRNSLQNIIKNFFQDSKGLNTVVLERVPDKPKGPYTSLALLPMTLTHGSHSPLFFRSAAKIYPRSIAKFEKPPGSLHGETDWEESKLPTPRKGAPLSQRAIFTLPRSNSGTDLDNYTEK